MSIIGLAGTKSGKGNTGATWHTQTASGNRSTNVTTSANNSLVVAMLENSGRNSGAGTPTFVAPLSLSNNGNWGSQWGSGASGGNGNTASSAYTVMANSPAGATTFGGSEAGSNWAGHAIARTKGLPVGTNTFSFNTGLTDVFCLAAEFLAKEIPATDYQIWASLYTGAGLSDPAADLDGDGLINDHERIWGLNPTSAISFKPIRVPLDRGAGTIQYTRRNPTLTGATYRYEWSVTLAANSWTAFTPVAANVVLIGAVETVTVTLDAGLLAKPSLFVRVVASPE